MVRRGERVRVGAEEDPSGAERRGEGGKSQSGRAARPRPAIDKDCNPTDSDVCLRF